MKMEITTRKPPVLSIILIFILIWPLVGCFQGKPIQQQYTLTTENPSPVLGKQSAQTTILIGPVKLATYLDQPRMIWRHGATRIDSTPNHLWGGDLSEMINYKLVAEIGSLLKPSPVFSYPNQAVSPKGRRVAVDILRFEATDGGRNDTKNDKTAAIEARWTLYDLGNKSIITTQSSLVHLPLTNDSYEALAMALSQGVTQLGQEIAQSIILSQEMK
jgi:uncharacterized lipoprotein YmbA